MVVCSPRVADGREHTDGTYASNMHACMRARTGVPSPVCPRCRAQSYTSVYSRHTRANGTTRHRLLLVWIGLLVWISLETINRVIVAALPYVDSSRWFLLCADLPVGARHAPPQVPLKEMDAFEGADVGKLLAEVKDMVKADRVRERDMGRRNSAKRPETNPPETLTQLVAKKAKSDEEAKRKSK